MNLLARRCIILLLLMLQGFAPLVHAHVHLSNSEYGVHLDGFESMTLHKPQMDSLGVVGHKHLTIAVDSGIQQKQRLADNAVDQTCFCLLMTVFVLPVLLTKQVGFSPPIAIVSTPLYLFDSAPRAPPIRYIL